MVDADPIHAVNYTGHVGHGWGDHGPDTGTTAGFGVGSEVLRQLLLRLPELFVDHDASPEQRVVITDDFGQRIAMSLTQLDDLVSDVKAGKLDALVGTP